MRQFMNLAVFVFTLTVIGFVFAGYWVIDSFKNPGPLQQETVFVVHRGENATSIGERLEMEGVIDSAFVFKFGVKYLGDKSFLKAGEYKLPPKLSMKDVLAKLQSGDTVTYKFTIPECATSYEVMNILNSVDIMVDELSKPPLEGSIYPETYHFAHGDSRSDTVGRMQRQMNILLDSLWLQYQGERLFKSPQEALILASIVEKESGNPDERRKVAGLFINRMKKGMRLQSDPTVIYGIMDGKPKNDGMGPLGRRLLKKDLEFDSPYNTYIYADLPPTPICNPGKASIEAVLNPEEHDYIYMVADGTGGHAFAKTLKEHNNNVRKWRKIRAEQE